ncbi:hypothetical protein H8B06_02265 [Sphingobacterium sp. DN00404]|uniref:Lipoprotein n=1 Tax=Sphingobacterium micropteri TaxID=2763501 RepID=A0ABR7YJY7_9SPHI|nr:hypothetical protein [Sphingobacterium micropteri]MBD1431636.1 hypothetical protein [Sphingobacterium micropteri]
MRWLVYIIMVAVLTACTSTRSLSRKFSEKPEVIGEQFAGSSYANTPIDTTGRYGRVSLWRKLAPYRSVKDSLPEIAANAHIRLSLEDNKTLKVTASENQQAVAIFEIPVRRRGEYLILENKTRIIPIPFIYFSVKENKTILVLLKNNRIGIYDYDDESLWILFFGASNTAAAIYEYEPITP